jgi:hypothetical protein
MKTIRDSWGGKMGKIFQAAATLNAVAALAALFLEE